MAAGPAETVRALIEQRLRNTALLVAGCFFMENLDGTIVVTAAPSMASSLGVSTASIGLVITSYLLTLAALIPLSGWMTARFGTRPVFLTAIAIFTLSSLGCALAPNLGTLVAMRVAQGVGGAMMVPVGRILVFSQTPRDQIIRVMSFIVWPGLLAPVIAPLAGGVITTYLSWHWLFLINLPLGIAAFAIAWRLIEEIPGSPTAALDWMGVVLTCFGLAGLTFAAYLFTDTGTEAARIVALAIVSMVVTAAAIWHLLRTQTPLLNLRLMRIPTFRIFVTGGTFYWTVVGSVPFLLPLLLQEALGWSPIRSGAVVLFVFAGNIGIKPATTWILNTFGFRTTLVWSTVGLGLATASFALVTSGTPEAVIATIALCQGVFRSIGLTAYSTIALSDIPPANMREANALNATTGQLSAGLGVVVATLALKLGGVWSGDAEDLTAFRIAFALVSLSAVVALVVALRLDRTAGDEIRTARQRVARARA
jgi:EmrB/QacA subfamily drug resistance transporter